MSTCIFCHKDSSSSKSVEHIIPESLGNKHHFLPKGYVCDECNHYFAIKIENELLSQPYFVSMRFRNEILTKKGRNVKEKMMFLGALKSVEAILQTTEDGRIISFYDEDLFDRVKNGEVNEIMALYIPEPDYPNKTMSRFLAKCAYEYFLYNMGKEKYDICVQELLCKESDILKALREYARYGKGEYWQYNQRRIYSEGDVVFNQNKELNYEILHEMKFFIREHKHLPNGHVEAEIYFVLAIAGIEYAICISDPNISEYQKWLEEHNGLSPLKDDAEVKSFSLSDINPMLIKKDDDRIHR